MRRQFQVTLLAGALVASGVAVHAQDDKPAPSRAAQRESPPPSRAGGSGGDRAVARTAPAPRAESPRAVSAPAPATASSGDSRRSRQGSGQAQPRQRTAPPDSRGGGDRAVARGGDTPRAAGDSAQPVRATERDRGGRQSFGTATPRRYPTEPGYGGGYGGGYYNPRWNSWYYPYVPLTYGLFWNPWWGYGAPYGSYGYNSGYGAGYGGAYGSGGYGGYGAYGPYQGPTYETYGGLRLKVKPRDAEVFVDGYFAGVVDDFDGAFQQLNLDVGPHRIEVRAAGYEPVSFEIRTQPDEKITYKGELKPAP